MGAPAEPRRSAWERTRGGHADPRELVRAYLAETRQTLETADRISDKIAGHRKAELFVMTADYDRKK